MLLSGMRESQGTEVSLHTISAQDLRLLVSFAYSGVVRAKWPGLLRAAQAALQSPDKVATVKSLHFPGEETEDEKAEVAELG